MFTGAIGRTLMLMAAMVCLLAGGCRRAGQQPGRKIVLQHISVTVPAAFEQKPGTHMFRVRLGSKVTRFLAFDEVPTTRSGSAVTVDQLRAALQSDGRIIEQEAVREWQGHRVVELTFRGTTKAGAAVRGRNRLIVFDDSVVSALWYAPVSEWNAAAPEMDAILDGISLR